MSKNPLEVGVRVVHASDKSQIGTITYVNRSGALNVTWDASGAGPAPYSQNELKPLKAVLAPDVLVKLRAISKRLEDWSDDDTRAEEAQDPDAILEVTSHARDPLYEVMAIHASIPELFDGILPDDSI